MRGILNPASDFRGSFGLHVTGHDEFAGYMRMIRDAFPDFYNWINDIVTTDDRTVAPLTYTGTR